MIEGLNNCDAVEINGKYLVQFQSILRDGNTYVIGGERINATHKQQILLDSIEDIFRVVTRPRKFLGFKNPETGKTLPAAKVYQERSQYLDEDDDINYPDLETHYRVEKRISEIETWEKAYEEAMEYLEPVQINVLGKYEDTGSEFIDSAIQQGKVKFGSGVYQVDSYKVAVDEVKKQKALQQGTEIEVPNHSGMKYVKVNGSYIFTGNDTPHYVKGPDKRVYTTLVEAQQREESVRKYVRGAINSISFSRRPTNDETKDILKRAQDIYDKTSEVDPKVKSATQHRQALRLIQELKTHLVGMVNEG